MSSQPPSRPPARIAFLGFSDFERSALASCFRLATESEPRFELVYTLTDADYLVADADHGPSVQLVVVTERLAETVFIGSPAPAGAAASMRRPIDALHVMKALEVVARAGRSASPATAAAPPVLRTPVRAADPPLPAVLPEADVIVESMLRMPPPPAAPAPARARPPAGVPTGPSADPSARPSAPWPAAQRAPAPLPPAAPARPQAFVGPPAPPRALVVDDSDIARRFLTSRLLPWGVRSDVAVTSAEVIELLAQRNYELIFLDIELGPESELDGLALCRHIKRSALAISATVIVVSAHHTEVDRARGSLAGCDVYLGKPIKDAELGMLLRRQGLVPPEGQGVKPGGAAAAAAAPAAPPVAAPATAAATAPKSSPA